MPRLAGFPTATFYLLALGVALVTVGTAWRVPRPWGAGLFAIHDDEDVAEVLGVPTYRHRLLALGLSAGWPASPAASTPCSSPTSPSRRLLDRRAALRRAHERAGGRPALDGAGGGGRR